ncbi:Metallo-dependent phosphatase-like protein [Ochromonadaceae sp. CCMP2298]|nr:Metallo-dependent phosphatase-like protein [Ochromonadaceae sp. CCMP2298]
MKSVGAIVLLSAAVALGLDNYAFLSVGDWGGNALDESFYTTEQNVADVAAAMATASTAISAKFIIGTGDNFYWCGITSTTDSQIAADFEQPYSAVPLQLKWYQSLGNHEYGYSVQAQIDYMQLNPNWILPNRYYTQRIEMADGIFMTILVLDTSPCISDYRNSNPTYWDPCSTQYPTCSQKGTDDDFEGECMFHENIVGQDCGVQYNWLKATMYGIPADDWLVVVGHHPIDEVNVLDFTTLLQERGFAIYLNGHTHLLNQYTIDGAGAYVTTGAGAMVNTIDQEHPITKAKLEGRDVTPEMRRAHRKDVNATDSATYSDHTYSKVWTQTVAGFTQHTFNSDFTSLTTDFVTYTGAIVNTFDVNKAGVITSQNGVAIEK